jgi:voltage-gated potassium channel
VLSITRNGQTLRFDDPLVGPLEAGDVVVVVKSHAGATPRLH